MTEPPRVRSPFERMAPPGMAAKPGDGPPPELPDLPRSHVIDRPKPRGLRRILGWFGLSALGVTAVMVPRPVGGEVQVMPRADDGRAQDPALAELHRLDGRGTAHGPASIFAGIVGRLADKAADLALDACLLLAAKGAWMMVRRRREKPGEDDPGAAELAALERWIEAQDRAALEQPAPDEATLRSVGRRMFARMRAEMRARICAEKGIPRKLAGDSTKEVAEQLRKALGRGEVSSAMALALAGLAAAVARMGFDAFCDPGAAVPA